ncbi:MAG: AAA family ATPase [bacterium]
MYYSNFKIKKYKGIKELNLNVNFPVDSKIFTLVGLNESGKTTILEAIYNLSNEALMDQRHNLIPKSDTASFTGATEIIATINFSSDDVVEIKKYINTNITKYVDFKFPENLKIYRYYNFDRAIPTTTEIKFGLDIEGQKKKGGKFIELPLNEKQQIYKHIKEEFLPEVIYYPDFLAKFPERIYLEPNTVSSTEMQYYNIIQDVLSTINGTFTVEETILNNLKNKSTAANKQALEKTESLMAAKISKVVFSAWGKFSKIGKKEIIVSTDIDPEGRSYLELRLKEGVDTFSISERSLGFRWFFTFLLFTEFRKERISSSGEILFLLDEPASNLHSTAQKNLLSTFSEITKKSKLIYTTHSHHLINPEWLSGAYIVRNKALNYNDEVSFDASQTDVEAIQYKKFVAENPSDAAYFQPILDVLEYQPGLLEEVPPIIITEGKNDYYSLKYICKVILKLQNFNFYPGTGASKLDQPIALYVSWGRNFVGLLDADKEGKLQKKRYLKEFGVDIHNRIFDLSDIDISFDKCSCEELFSKTEKLGITKYFDPKSTVYEKSKFNSGIQMLLAENKEFEISNETKNKFLKIFNFLSEKIN